MWQFEPGHPIPDGVSIYYDTHEAVYKGELASRIKAEMQRRSDNIYGKATPDKTYRFRGLLICAECGYSLSKYGKRGWYALRCYSKYQQSATRANCDNTKMISEKRVQSYFDHLLRKMLMSGTPDTFTVPPNDTENVATNVAALEKEITDLDTQIRRMILRQTSATADVENIYEQEIAKAGARLKTLRQHLKELQGRVTTQDNMDRQRAFDEIMRLSVDELWQQEDRVINQILIRLMGQQRFVVKKGEIIGIATAPKHSRRF